MVVQRSWKIQSDANASTITTAAAASTSSSTVAASTASVAALNAGNSSSDDSNGSNQTTHSIATSVASSTHKTLEATTTPTAAVVTANETIKYVTTPQMAEQMLLRLRHRLCPPVVGCNATNESVMRSLELLRINVQQAFDKEIDGIIKQFMDSYFKPAIHNIKENMGALAVTDEMLLKMSCVLLENSKTQYSSFRLKSLHTHAAHSAAAKCSSDNATPARLPVKRAAAATQKTQNEQPPAKKSLAMAPTNTSAAVTNTAHNNPTMTAAAAIAKASIEPSIVAPACKVNSSSGSASTATPPRRQIFWHTANITSNTNFVLDVQANQAFGFGTDGKERLASKHPELIRYLPDAEDRDWLIAQNIISAQNRNSRFLFLIYDEVFKLYQQHEVYKKKSNVMLSIMHTFKVPEFMIQKMKLFFVDLNIKSRGLITNSFCATSTSTAPQGGNSHLRNALLQGQQQQLAAAASSSTSAAATTSATATSVSTSGLEPPCGAIVNVNNASTSSVVIVSSGVSTSITQESVASVVAAPSSSSAAAKTKPSTLSSSHATLTALLNNQSTSNVVGPIIISNSSSISNVVGRSTISTTHSVAANEKIAKKTFSKLIP